MHPSGRTGTGHEHRNRTAGNWGGIDRTGGAYAAAALIRRQPPLTFGMVILTVAFGLDVWRNHISIDPTQTMVAKKKSGMV